MDDFFAQGCERLNQFQEGSSKLKKCVPHNLEDLPELILISSNKKGNSWKHIANQSYIYFFYITKQSKTHT